MIKAIPGVKFQELERIRENSWCCGSGIGTVRLVNPDLALTVDLDRTREIIKSGTKVVASACPMCIEQLELGGRTLNAGLEYINLPELVADAMGV